MRSIRYSRTFHDELGELLEQGIDRFGARVVAEKRDLVFRTIETKLVHQPVRSVDPDLGICAYHVSRTPFVLLYDYDDAELRIHIVMHASADRTQIDLSAVVW